MKEYLLPLKNKEFDGINFYRNGDGDFEISAFNYKSTSEKVGGTDLGDLYDIIVFPENPPKLPERFQAILISPLHYISRMMDDGFLGVVAKTTTTSEKFIDDIFDVITKKAQIYIDFYEEQDDDE